MLPVAFTRRFGLPVASRRLLDPFREFDRWACSLGGDEPRFAAPLDVREDEGHYVVDADVPGFDKDDIEVTLEDGVLTISGERKHEEKSDGENYHYSERRTGRFSRSLRFPDGVSEDGIEAALKDGVLTVKVAKPAEVQPRKIEVKGA